MSDSDQEKRAEVDGWLNARQISLHPKAWKENPALRCNKLLNKAGLLPFVEDAQGSRRFLFMRPRAEHPELEPPRLQICKGTRMGKKTKGWCDVGKNASPGQYTEIEPLVVTALREGIEELGVILSNINEITDAGVVSFTSSRTNAVKPLALFLARMESIDRLLPMEKVESSTVERRWLSAEEFALKGRPDHWRIVQELFF